MYYTHIHIYVQVENFYGMVQKINFNTKVTSRVFESDGEWYFIHIMHTQSICMCVCVTFCIYKEYLWMYVCMYVLYVYIGHVKVFKSD